jgi:crotonobetainyl-CoA:carnitine CoA-transferase CaiB-like acyl-CoA transferase
MKLEGIRVIDLSVFLPGPYLTLALADHGAEVIKIEPPGEGDPARSIGVSDGPTSVAFRNINRGKKSIVLDLKAPGARERLLSLCDDADVFVESYRPGVMKRLGADYETVSRRNPRIVYCSISAFTGTAPRTIWRRWRSAARSASRSAETRCRPCRAWPSLTS